MLKGWKTVIFNIMMTAIGIIAVINPGADLPDLEVVTAALDGLDAAIVAVWGVGNLILRAITTSPIFKKDE